MSNREIRPDHVVTVECQELAALRAQLAEAKKQRDETRDYAMSEASKLRAQLTERDAEVGRLRALIEKRGHDERCASQRCIVCGWPENQHGGGALRDDHAFDLEGPCDCGYADLMGAALKGEG